MSRYPEGYRASSPGYRDEPDVQPHPQGAGRSPQAPVGPGSNSNTELQDYWDDGPLPPPHRFSNTNPRSSYDDLHENPFDSDPDLAGPLTRSQNRDYTYNPDETPMNRFSSPYGGGTAGYGNLGAASARARGGTSSMWLNGQSKRGTRSRRLLIGGIIVVAVAVIGGIIAGVVISKKHSSFKSTSSTSSSNSSTTTGTPDPNTDYFAVVKQTDPNDPSSFQKDSALTNSFYGVAYTPFGSQIPACGANIRAVIEDIQLISQITNKLRLYGADCNQSSLVLDAIQQTKVDMSVWLGNYVLPGDDAGYTRQRDEINTALNTFGSKHVAGITVGNEFMLNYLNANGGGSSDPNSAVANQGAQYLISKISDTKQSLQSLNLGSIPVGTADAGAYFNNEVLAAVNYGMANVHPWFANQTIDAAASWTTTFFQNTDIAASQAVSNTPQMYIAETGWPTQSEDEGNASNGPSTASVPNLQTFINDFVCSSNQNGINYFFFEVFDEPWKNATFGGVEGYWGIFNFNKTLKALTLPSCSHS